MWMLEVTTSFMWPVNWEESEGERMGVWDSEECYLDPYQVAVGDGDEASTISLCTLALLLALKLWW